MFDNPLLEVPALLGIPMVIERIGNDHGDRPNVATILTTEYESGLAPPEWQSNVGDRDAINQAQAFQKVGLDLIDFLFRPSNYFYRLNSYSIG